MNGYLLNFYKNSPLRNDILKKEDMRNRLKCNFVKNIVWSAFDRLEIRKIERFKDFRTSGDSEKEWVGERQFSMIYDVCDSDEDRRLIYKDTSETVKCRFAFVKNNTDDEKMRQYRFFGVSMIDFTEVAYNSFFSNEKPILSARDKLLKALDELIEKNSIPRENICFDIYGTLGGNDIVVIWLSNQFDELLQLIEALRCSRIKNSESGIMANVYTVVGMRDVEDKKITYSDVRGTLNIHLTKRDGQDLNQFKDKLAQELELSKEEIGDTIKSIAGEYDLSINITANKLVSELYEANGIIHMGQDIFYKNFLQANTEVASECDYSDVIGTEIELLINNNISTSYDVKEKEISDLVKEICEMEMMTKTPYLGETLWILYADYLKNITSIFSYPWTEDLHYQFKTCLKCLGGVVSGSMQKKRKYKYIEFIIKNLRQVILHVSQANRIFFEVPNTHLKHTGTYSKILRAYQGIVKLLIKQAYLIPRYAEQTEIIPFVTFDTIPIPTSNAVEIPEQKIQLVEIKLPYEALVDIPHYTYLLAHEVYHYIAPTDREIRNELISIVLISAIATNVLFAYVKDIMDEMQFLDKLSSKDAFLSGCRSLIERFSKNYVMNNFQKFRDTIVDYDATLEYKKFIKKLNEVYIEGEFDECICGLFFEILSLYNYRELYKFVPEDEKIHIQSFVEHLCSFNSVEDNVVFVDFLKDSLTIRTITENHKYIQAALREVMADFYMIQIMDMQFGEYIKYILKDKDLIAITNNDLMQGLRLALVYNYCFNNGESITKTNLKEWSLNAKNIIENIADINDEDREYALRTIFSNYKMLLAYDDLFLKHFELLEFSKFGNIFEQPLRKSKKKLVVDEGDDFETNVAYVEKLQIHEPLETLYQNANTTSVTRGAQTWKCNENCFMAENKADSFKTARNFNELIDFIGKAAKKISDTKHDDKTGKDSYVDEIWYRGHGNSQYKLIPSLYRMKDEKTQFYDASLRNTMETLFKFFKIKSFNAPEIFFNGNDTLAGIMASMQHYSVPTNILDWTPAVLNAIYFAVENHMDGIDAGKLNDCEVWLLNPARMNEQFKNISRGAPSKIYPVPSIWGEEEKYAEYFPFVPYCNRDDKSCVPVAVYVPFSNQRIKAQFGTFTMFSLDADGKSCENYKDFSMWDLSLLHEEERLKAHNGCEFKPFLIRVRIAASAVEDVVEHLKIMGIHKHTVYPELENISKDITNHVKSYLDKSE